MKTTRYKFEQVIQEVKEDTTEWLTEELRAILVSEKDFTRKCDYIGFSIASLDSKVASLDEEIKELQALKKSLKAAKDITLTTGAKVFSEYGIDKIEGAGISSITVTNPTTKVKQNLEIFNHDELIAAGFYKKVLDEEAVIKAYEGLGSNGDRDLVQSHSKITIHNIITEAKLKINKRRATNKTVPLSLKELEVAS